MPGYKPAATLGEWLARIDDRSARIGIVGLGYVGLPLTLMLAEDGFRVTGFDTDPAKVDALNMGQSYIHRIEPEHIAAAQRAGFRATADFVEAGELDAILICVPTPLYPDHTPDMRAVVSTNPGARAARSRGTTGGAGKHDLSRHDGRDHRRRNRSQRNKCFETECLRGNNKSFRDNGCILA